MLSSSLFYNGIWSFMAILEDMFWSFKATGITNIGLSFWFEASMVVLIKISNKMTVFQFLF